MSKRLIPLKPDEKRIIDDPCPCCGSQAVLRCINLVVSVQCVDMACGLKVERWIVNRRTSSVCAKECLKAWRRRDKPMWRPPKFRLPAWANYVAQVMDGWWYCFEQKPQVCDFGGWATRGGRARCLRKNKTKNPLWWATLRKV